MFILICHSFSNTIQFNKALEFNAPFGKRTFNANTKKKLIRFAEVLHTKNVVLTSYDFREFPFDTLPQSTLYELYPQTMIYLRDNTSKASKTLREYAGIWDGHYADCSFRAKPLCEITGADWQEFFLQEIRKGSFKTVNKDRIGKKHSSGKPEKETIWLGPLTKKDFLKLGDWQT